jgi:primary-amine oxidase
LLDSATARAFEAIVDLPTNLRDGKQVDVPVVSDWVALEGTVQPSLQVEELLWSEEICRKDPGIAKAARAVGVEPENLYVDGEYFPFEDMSDADPSTYRLVHRY